jgi:hypothetical protein
MLNHVFMEMVAVVVLRILTVTMLALSPFKFLLDQKTNTAHCIMYDEAGTSRVSVMINAYESGYQRQSFTKVEMSQEKPTLKISEEKYSFISIAYILL